MCLVDPKSLRFSQPTASKYFTDNSDINILITSLANSLTLPDAIPQIRVVQHQGAMWTLDNRRLIAFCSADLPLIHMRLVSLSTTTVRREFTRKFKPIDDIGKMIVVTENRQSAKEALSQLRQYGKVR